MLPQETGLPALVAQLLRGQHLLLFPDDIGGLGLLLRRLFLDGRNHGRSFRERGPF